MSRIKIVDLEVHYCVGISDAERAKPQRLLITVDMEFDFNMAAQGDRLNKTIDYFAVAQEILKYGTGRNWKLVEKVAVSVAELVKSEFHPESVTIEVKKFVLPQPGYVSVSWTQS
jgi:FolB domain-containing protein